MLRLKNNFRDVGLGFTRRNREERWQEGSESEVCNLGEQLWPLDVLADGADDRRYLEYYH